MVLGVWDSHTRLLLPSAESLPSIWKSWHATIGTGVYRQWASWRVSPVTDSAHVLFYLAHCRICSRNVRIPALEGLWYDGVQKSWWGRWSPCSHTTEPEERQAKPPEHPRRLQPPRHNRIWGEEY